jgi:hypothetical protein
LLVILQNTSLALRCRKGAIHPIMCDDICELPERSYFRRDIGMIMPVPWQHIDADAAAVAMFGEERINGRSTSRHRSSVARDRFWMT